MSTPYEQARQQVVKLREFYKHVVVYAVVNAGLVVINLLDSPGTLWFPWPLLGWGVGLALHAFTVLGPSRWNTRAWEERQIQKIMERDG